MVFDRGPVMGKELGMGSEDLDCHVAGAESVTVLRRELSDLMRSLSGRGKCDPIHPPPGTPHECKYLVVSKVA